MAMTPPMMPPAIGPTSDCLVALVAVVFEELGKADDEVLVELVVELKNQTALSAPGRTVRGQRITYQKVNTSIMKCDRIHRSTRRTGVLFANDPPAKFMTTFSTD